MPNWKKVITSGSNAHLNHITASGDISSSDTIDAQRLHSGGASAAFFNGAAMRLSSNTNTTEIYGSQITIKNNTAVDGQITASGVISASGGFVGDGSGLTNVSATATPAGSDTQVQFNDGGSLGASSILTFDGTNLQSTFLESTRGSVINTSGHSTGDFRVAGDTDTHLLFTDASEDKVAIGTLTVGNSLLTIDGDVTATHITSSGNISSSGDLQSSKLTIVKTGASSNEKLISLTGGAGSEKFSVDEDGDLVAQNIRLQTNSQILFSDNNDQIYFDGDDIVLSVDDSDQLQVVSDRVQTNYPLYVAGTSAGNGHITASGDISASGDITTKKIITPEFSLLNPLGTNPTITKGTANAFDFSNHIEVTGNITSTGDVTVGGANLFVGSDDSVQWELMSHSSGLLFRSSSTQYMNITDEGNVQIGKASTADSGEKLQVTGDISSSGFISTLSHITASGNISASGNVKTNLLQAFGSTGIITNGGTILGNSAGDTHKFTGNITASGNISSSEASIASFGTIELAGGGISIKNKGAQSYVNFYCESNNAHFVKLQAPAHSDFSGNVTVTLPATTDTLVGKTTTDTLTNKTLTSPDINTPDIDGGTIDNTVIGGTTKAAGSFTTLLSTGNTTLGNGIDDTHTFNGHITASGDISASGNAQVNQITASAFQFVGSGNAELEVQGHITASGNISSSNNVICNEIIVGGGTFTSSSLAAGGSGGGGGISFDGSTANGVTTFKDSDEVTVEANLTFDGTTLITAGNLSASGNFQIQQTASIQFNHFDTGSNPTGQTYSANGQAQGDIVKFGSVNTSTMTAGKIYFLNGSGQWVLADATDDTAGADELLAIALGTDPATDGMLLRGIVKVNSNITVVGRAVYMSTTAGAVSQTLLSGNDEIVRVVGYGIDTSKEIIYFNPDSTFVKITA